MNILPKCIIRHLQSKKIKWTKVYTVSNGVSRSQQFRISAKFHHHMLVFIYSQVTIVHLIIILSVYSKKEQPQEHIKTNFYKLT